MRLPMPSLKLQLSRPIREDTVVDNLLAHTECYKCSRRGVESIENETWTKQTPPVPGPENISVKTDV
jgi:hypothetical protein